MVCRTVLVSFVLGAFVDARSFRKSAGDFSETVGEQEMKATLLEEIEHSLGSVSQRGRFARLEAALAPMYKALPKNEHGKLGHTTVRYALHRVFVQRHGWFIKGLEPAGQHFNSSTPTGVLKEHVGSHVEELFESRLGGQGFSLHDTAVLAATLEHLIHNEAEGRLGKTYNKEDFSRSRILNSVEAGQVLDGYMKFYLLPDALAQKIGDSDLTEVFPGWPETQKFTHDVLKELSRNGEDMSFGQMTAVVEEIGERFGQFQNHECKTMKAKLIKLGDQGIGRVPLPAFYRSLESLEGSTFEFQESPAYLKELGVLDDEEQVIVPNYIGSHTNCIASSSLYSVCCIDECEQMMGQLEREIAAPEATPAQIVGLVSGMSSSTVEAPRNLPTKLVNRLDDAAAQHGGSVQLHGRLFAQWMHHAFPRECPFPHVSGSITPVTPDEWLDSKGNDGYATRDEMLHYTSKVEETKTPQQEQFEHWIDHEELLVLPVRERRRSSSKTSTFFFVLLLGAALCGVLKSAPIDVLQAGICALKGDDQKKADIFLSVFSGKSHML